MPRSVSHEEKKVSSKKTMDSSMQDCIDLCNQCADICSSVLNTTLSSGRNKSDANHIQTLIACAEICSLNSRWMSREFDFHKNLCKVVAEISQACADSCKLEEDEKSLQACMDACKKCAASCRRMSLS